MPIYGLTCRQTKAALAAYLSDPHLRWNFCPFGEVDQPLRLKRTSSQKALAASMKVDSAPLVRPARRTAAPGGIVEKT